MNIINTSLNCKTLRNEGRIEAKCSDAYLKESGYSFDPSRRPDFYLFTATQIRVTIKKISFIIMKILVSQHPQGFSQCIKTDLFIKEIFIFQSNLLLCQGP